MTALHFMYILLLVGLWSCGTELPSDVTVSSNPVTPPCTMPDCPFGSYPSEERTSDGECKNSAGTTGLTGEGRIEGVCQGTGQCRVFCSLLVPCCRGFRLDQNQGTFECDVACSSSDSSPSTALSSTSSMNASQAEAAGSTGTTRTTTASDGGDAGGGDDPGPETPAGDTGEPPADPGDTEKSAGDLGDLILATGPVVFPDKFEFVGSNAADYYKFELSRDATWTIAVELSGVENGVTVQLFRDAAILNVQMPDYSISATKVGDAVVDTQNLARGTYYLRVVPYSRGDALYRITLTVTAYDSGQEPETDPGRASKDAFDVGRLEAQLKQYGGYVGSLDALDNYRFEIENAATVELSGSNVNGSVYIKLYAFTDPLDTSMQLMQFLTQSETQTKSMNLADGSYIVSVSHYGSDVGSLYTLGLRVVQ